ncbi:MAG TPA: SDR family oxidoreductase, partial [Acidimicrobiales bacterium]|nr:SDR family oxidoreductase [Acidimicrobiales bacterium]
ITGATRGLGRVLATAFSRAGARVAVVGRDETSVASACAELDGEVIACPGDIRRPEDNERIADRVVAEWGGLDVWVANAGVSPVVGGPLDISPEVWAGVIEVNLTGVFLGARAAARVMGPGGRIIATASVLGERPRRGLSAYSASKAGVIGLVKALALDLAPSGITVNAVNLGWFDSPLIAGWQQNPRLEQSILDHVALRRWGASEDLPGAFLYLASDASAFVTGSALTVDGGYLCV